MSQDLRAVLRDMLLIRRFEEKLDDLFSSGVIKGTSHLYAGQEAVATGVCAILRPDDMMTSTHRGHGHFLAKGGSPSALMAELWGKATGPSKGRGGSQHVADYSIGFLGSNGITAGGLPIATGAALAAKMKQTGQVVVAFFGEGGANQGTFHEAINMAAVWKLPVLFVCENNQYAMSTRYDEIFATPTIAARAAGYGIAGEVVDGTDFFSVCEAIERGATRARNGEGPSLIEMLVYRYYGHSKSDKCEYRTREEEAEWRAKDCIGKLQTHMGLSNEEYRTILEDVDAEVEAAVEFARESSEPEIEDLESALYA
ncbi:acetoin:2,6-dichlorophenolindophenol oxidoreductase subunit alpha [Abditibacteriota bacterium]|nr:acetoin:2,6-dichlorophenolindophenol oxidoreductase subunit alpha [Abditibacteriota bacterium]